MDANHAADPCRLCFTMSEYADHAAYFMLSCYFNFLFFWYFMMVIPVAYIWRFVLRLIKAMYCSHLSALPYP